MSFLQRWFKKIHEHMPTQQTLFESRWLKPFAHRFNHDYFWQLNQANAALSVAIGLFCGLMPGPTQMFSALLVAYCLRTNIPLAMLTTLYTNPLTYLPLYYLAYKIGAMLLAVPPMSASLIMPNDYGYEALSVWWDWLMHFGKPLLVGVPILGLSLALIGYVVVWVSWRWLRPYFHRH